MGFKVLHYTLSELCNPKTSFPTPFVDFQRGDTHLLKLSGKCNPNSSIEHWHQHPPGWFKCQNNKNLSETHFPE